MTDPETGQLTGVWSTGGINLVLQTATLASKALLLFGLPRFLSPVDFGVFGLILVTLDMTMSAVGLDFYTFSTRELIRRPRDAMPRMLRDQLTFHGLTYVVVLPAVLLAFVFGVLPWQLAAVFVVLVMVEHLAQEMQRVLIALRRPVQAASLAFIRGGLWVYVVLALMIRDSSFRTVQTVMLGWVAGATVSLIGGVYLLRRQRWSLASGPVDWRWIGAGIRVGIPFLGATLALRGVFSADRYALKAFSGVEAVGIYTLYASIRNAIQSLLEMGVVAVFRPRIVGAYQRGDKHEYRSLMRNLTIALLGTAAALCLIAAVGIVPVLSFVGDPVYGDDLLAYWLLLVVAFVAALGEVPHTALYAQEKDRAIVVSSVVGLVVAVVLSTLLVPRFGLTGAALATLISCGTLASMKAAFLRAN